jgi:hypothetical protein
MRLNVRTIYLTSDKFQVNSGNLREQKYVYREMYAYY